MRISDWSSDVCSSDLEELEVAIELFICRLLPLVRKSKKSVKHTLIEKMVERQYAPSIALSTVSDVLVLEGDRDGMGRYQQDLLANWTKNDYKHIHDVANELLKISDSGTLELATAAYIETLLSALLEPNTVYPFPKAMR